MLKKKIKRISFGDIYILSKRGYADDDSDDGGKGDDEFDEDGVDGEINKDDEDDGEVVEDDKDDDAEQFVQCELFRALSSSTTGTRNWILTKTTSKHWTHNVNSGKKHVCTSSTKACSGDYLL